MIKPLLVQLFSFHHDFGWLLSSVCLTYDSIFALFLGYLLSLILPLFRHKLDLDQYHQWHDGPQMEQGLLTHADVCPYISICALSLSLSLPLIWISMLIDQFSFSFLCTLSDAAVLHSYKYFTLPMTFAMFYSIVSEIKRNVNTIRIVHEKKEIF